MAQVCFFPADLRQESAFCALQWRRTGHFQQTCSTYAAMDAIGPWKAVFDAEAAEKKSRVRYMYTGRNGI